MNTEHESRCVDCGGLLPSPFNYCPGGEASIVSLPPVLDWIVPPWRSVRADPQEPETGCWPFVGDQFLAAVRVRRNGSSERCRADLDKKAWYWEYTVLTWSETGLEADGEAWSAWSEADIDFIARIPEPDAVKAGQA